MGCTTHAEWEEVVLGSGSWRGVQGRLEGERDAGLGWLGVGVGVVQFGGRGEGGSTVPTEQ